MPCSSPYSFSPQSSALSPQSSVLPMSSPLLTQFQSAIEGLYFPSETDYPFEVALWQEEEAPTVENLLEQTEHPLDSPVETVELREFFHPVLQEQDWHSEEERSIVQKFRNLVELIEQTLSTVKVYQVGSIEVDVYIVGYDETSGNWVILLTKMVET
jgi:hypothetical protein